MPTVADDIILSQLSYRDNASTPEADTDKATKQKVLQENNQEYIKPLNGFDLDAYLEEYLEFTQPKDAPDDTSGKLSFDSFSDPQEMEELLSKNWSDLTGSYDGFSLNEGETFYLDQLMANQSITRIRQGMYKI